MYQKKHENRSEFNRSSGQIRNRVNLSQGKVLVERKVYFRLWSRYCYW